MSNYKEFLYLAVPKGELEGPTFDTFRKVGYEVPETKGEELIARIGNAPIILVKGRAFDIPQNVFDEVSRASAGITGSDILWEAGYGRGAIGTEIPIETYFPGLITPEIYLGVPNDFSEKTQREKGRYVVPEDLKGKKLFTKFTRVASDYLSDCGVVDVDIQYRGGSMEAMPYLYPTSAIVDIWVSGKTANDNGIARAATIAPVTTRFFENSEKVTGFEQRVIDEIREIFLMEEQRTKTPTTAYL